MASHLLPLTLSVTVVIDVRHAYIITLPALFINPSDYLTVTQVFSNRSIMCTLIEEIQLSGTDSCMQEVI